MDLNIKNRLILLQILPTKGNLSDMVEVMDLAKQLKLTDSEKELIEYTEDNNHNFYWNETRDFNKKIELNSDKIKILKSTIDTMDKDNNIPLFMVDLAIQIKNL